MQEKNRVVTGIPRMLSIPYNQNIWRSFKLGSLVNCVTITKFNVHHLDYNHGFLSIEYSKLPIQNPINSMFRVNCQLQGLPIILVIWYVVQKVNGI